MNLNSSKYKTITQSFIDCYKKLEDQYKGSAPQEQIYQEALELLKRERQSRAETTGSLSEAFQAASIPKQTQNLGIDVKDIFKK